MSQESVERFLGRVITDDRFRDRACSALEQCCITEGFTLSKAETAYLSTLDFKLLSFVSTTLDDAIRRS